MAISKVKLPDNSSQELHDYRISGVDSSPSSGSGNVVTSGGVYTALAGKQDTISDLATIRSGASAGATAYQKPSTGIPASDLAAGVIPTVTPEVFWATYGTTTYAEVLAAYNAGKLVCVNHNGVVFVLSSYNSTDSEFLFASCNEEFHIEFLYLHSEDDEWEGVGTPLAGTVSPTFTGTPTAPTAATGTNTTQIATTAFVQNTINSSSSKEVFVAIQGYTSYDDIETAVENGKIVFAVYHDDYYLPLIDFGQSAEFAAVVWYGSAGWSIMYTSVDDEGWYNVSTSPLELTSNKVTSLSSSSTDTQYPSAKATYDEVHPSVGSSQPSGGMLPNIVYDLGTLSGSTTFSLASPSDNNIANHYFWTFDTGSTAPTITWPAGISSWYGGAAPEIAASKHYEVSVLDGVGICMEV